MTRPRARRGERGEAAAARTRPRSCRVVVGLGCGHRAGPRLRGTRMRAKGAATAALDGGAVSKGGGAGYVRGGGGSDGDALSRRPLSIGELSPSSAIEDDRDVGTRSTPLRVGGDGAGPRSSGTRGADAGGGSGRRPLSVGDFRHRPTQTTTAPTRRYAASRERQVAGARRADAPLPRAFSVRPRPSAAAPGPCGLACAQDQPDSLYRASRKVVLRAPPPASRRERTASPPTAAARCVPPSRRGCGAGAPRC